MIGMSAERNEVERPARTDTGGTPAHLSIKYRPRVVNDRYECRAERSGATGANSTKCAGPGSLLPGEGAGVQWTPLSRRLRSADRAGRRDPAAQQRRKARRGALRPGNGKKEKRY